MALYVGLDLGGTKFLVAAADGHGRILERVQEPTPQALDAGLSAIERMISAVSAGRPIAGIGAAIGGPLDWKSGVVSPLHQPAWRGVPLKSIIEKRWLCPFHVDVDTNVAALGEYHYGCADGARPSRMVYITLSTGMGGGVLIDGRILRGSGGAHPEVGHQAVAARCTHPERVSCECGASDCLEALVSGNGIRRVYGRPPEELGEAEWDEVAHNLGQGLRNIAALHAPEVIVLGGGIAFGRGERLLAPARRVMESGLRLVPPPEVRLSRLGYDTALAGAVAVAIHGLAG